MKKSDIGVVAIVYGICLFFFVMVVQLPKEAQIYPTCLVAALFILNTIYIGRALFVYLKTRKVEDDWHEQFGDFKAGQFFGTAALGVAYMVALWLVGFYISSVSYLILSMLFLKVPKLHIALTTGVVISLVYAVFTMFLKVPLPVGLLFK